MDGQLRFLPQMSTELTEITCHLVSVFSFMFSLFFFFRIYLGLERCLSKEKFSDTLGVDQLFRFLSFGVFVLRERESVCVSVCIQVYVCAHGGQKWELNPFK